MSEQKLLAGMIRVTYILVDINSIMDFSGNGKSHGRQAGQAGVGDGGTDMPRARRAPDRDAPPGARADPRSRAADRRVRTARTALRPADADHGLSADRFSPGNEMHPPQR